VRPDAQMAIAAVLQTAMPIKGPVTRLTLELMPARHCSDNCRRHWCRCDVWSSSHGGCHLRNREIHEERSLGTCPRNWGCIGTLVVAQDVRTLVGLSHAAVEAETTNRCRIPWWCDEVVWEEESGMVNTFVRGESIGS
jgi:hypothetical protein